MVIKKKAVRKKRIVDKPFADGEMSSAAFFGMLRATLRNKSRWYPSISICRNKAKIPYVGANKRRKWSYVCEGCGNAFDGKMINVHHKIECGDLKSFDDLPGFTKRLFCDSQDLAVLCNHCHDRIHGK